MQRRGAKGRPTEGRRGCRQRVVELQRSAIHIRHRISSLERRVPKAVWQRPLTHHPPGIARGRGRRRKHLPRYRSTRASAVGVGPRRCRVPRFVQRQCGSRDREQVWEQCGGRKAGSCRFLGYKDVPGFMQRLRAVEGTSARALEFGILAAARTEEVIGTKWSEIDLEAKTWTAPKERMKASEIHLVRLSDRAIEISKRKKCRRQVRLREPAQWPPSDSNMAMLLTLRRMKIDDESEKTIGDITTVHGLCRASFSTWAYEAAGARLEGVRLA